MSLSNSQKKIVAIVLVVAVAGLLMACVTICAIATLIDTNDDSGSTDVSKENVQPDRDDEPNTNDPDDEPEDPEPPPPEPPDPVVCATCNGEGTVSCSTCGGTGLMVCSVCGGTGQTWGTSWDGQMTYTPCYSCNAGWRSCGACAGSGRMPCPSCQ